MAGPRQIIDPPTFTSSRYGLLSVANRLTTVGSHWQNGITWSSYCNIAGMGAATYDECIATTGAPDGAVPEPSAKEPNVEHVLRGATPFTPLVRFDCSPVGNEEATKVASDALARVEDWQVEYAFWTGIIDGKTLVFPHLSANAEKYDTDGVLLQPVASPVVSGGPHDPATALGLLEEALGDCYGGRGVIHVPLRLLATMISWGLIAPAGGRNTGGRFDQALVTSAGNLVAVGAGYPGTGPTGADPGPEAAWMYATGQVFVARSDVKISPFTSAVNRENNTIEMIAERTYVLGWDDCCLLAVQVALGGNP